MGKRGEKMNSARVTATGTEEPSALRSTVKRRIARRALCSKEFSVGAGSCLALASAEREFSE